MRRCRAERKYTTATGALIMVTCPINNGSMNGDVRAGCQARCERASALSAGRVAVAGLLALAVAMGIGRFAFTPILPMMQADTGLSVAAAGWLAAANYLGYFFGALCAARLSLRWAIRGGLVLVAAATFAMGVATHFPVWLGLRFVAGVASAWILVHVSAWALEHLLRVGRPDVNGVVFAGVGVGIAAAGWVCMGLMGTHASSASAWECFGVIAAVLCVLLWRVFGDTAQGDQGEVLESASPVTAPAGAESAPLASSTRDSVAGARTADRVRLVLCYGAFGFGYIVPATFLPAMAHRYIDNPAIFGWAWPVFGAAAALSTWMVSRWLHGANNRKLWAGAYVMMAVGVALPVLWPGLAAILIAALLVGGTFMLATMLGLREARRVAGADATGLMGALTASFAFMQVVGPVVVSAVAQLPGGFSATLLAAAVVLLVAAWALWRSVPRLAA